MKDLFVITGCIEDLKNLARKLDNELMRSTDDSDVDYEALHDLAEQTEEIVNTLVGELE